jgi:hypothetical protein
MLWQISWPTYTELDLTYSRLTLRAAIRRPEATSDPKTNVVSQEVWTNNVQMQPEKLEYEFQI